MHRDLSSSGRPLREPLRALTRSMALVGPVLLVMVYVKWFLVHMEWQFLPADIQENLWLRLTLLRAELLVGCAMVTGTWLTLLRFRSNRWVVGLAALAALLNAGLIIQLCAYFLLRRFVSPDILCEGILWGIRNPGPARDYLPRLAVLKLALAAGLPLACVGALLLVRHRVLHFVSTASLVALVASTMFVWARRPEFSIYHRNVLLLIAHPTYEQFVTETLNDFDAVTEYRKRAHAPYRTTNHPFWGKGRGANILWFVFETLPSRHLRLDARLDDLPSLNALRTRAWVGRKHFTTYPLTNRAFFSLFSSQYPPDRTGTALDAASVGSRGLVRELKPLGYWTGVYGSGNEDFENYVLSQAVDRVAYCKEPGIESYESGWRSAQRISDEKCLDLLKADIRALVSKSRRFMIVFAPQVGHGPWTDMGAGRIEAAVRELVRLQDKWLGEISTTLKETNMIHNTIIVVTSDHGVRFREEDPRVSYGALHEDMFHVPLLVYAPMAISRTEYVEWLTSHMDVAPTILDLLGVERPFEYEQGAPIWEEGVEKRTTCFWAGTFLGADACYENGRFILWDRTREMAYEAEKLEFTKSEAVPRTSPRHAEIKRRIRDMDRVRRAWLSTIAAESVGAR